MQKKYTAKSIVSLTANVGKYGRRISFSPLTNESSYFITKSKVLQDAIERHRFFKSGLIRLESQEEEEKPVDVEKKMTAAVKPTAVEADAPKLQEVVVAGQSDAVDFLTEHFGISRSKLRSQKAIAEVGKQNGVVFVYN